MDIHYLSNSDDSNNIWNRNRNNNQNDGKYGQNRGGNNGNGQGGPSRPNNGILLVIIISALIFAFSFFANTMQGINRVSIPYSQFLQYLNNGDILSVSIVEEKEIDGMLKDGAKFNTRIPYYDPLLTKMLEDNGITFSGSQKPVTFFQILSSALPWLVSIVFILYMLRSLRGFGGGGGMPFTKGRIRSYIQNQNSKTTFNDVAGQAEAKYELKEVVEFLKSPEKFERIGAKIPRGVLLVGSPGTGKTLLARACAGEAGVKFFYMSGSDFVEMFAGVGASRVRELFDQARKNSPCIIFIDELDAVGRSRSSGYGGGVHDEREQTLNQLLVEMDGFDIRDRIIVLAATNRPDVLDQALLRPGRFDRQVVVDMPDLNEREAILHIHSKDVKLSDKVDINTIARATPGCSGADLASLINESALLAARAGKVKIEMADLEEARDKILMGAARKSKAITPDEKKRIARHEAGHALLHFLLKNADPLHKVTIIPRGRAMGVAFSLPEKDVYVLGKGYLMDRISICYGGYISEQMYYKETSTGVQNDLEQATRTASRMVRDWGMSKLGPVSYSEKKTSLFLPVDTPSGVGASDETEKLIDKEIRVILDEGYNSAKSLLEKNKSLLDKIAEALIKYETLIEEQITALIQGNTIEDIAVISELPKRKQESVKNSSERNTTSKLSKGSTKNSNIQKPVES